MKVSANRADLHVSARGEGPACLVLCNLGAAVYERQMPRALDQRLRMVFVDLRGSGQSTGDPAELTFEVLAHDLEAVRAALGVDRVAVLGHSILSMLAIEHARRRPDRVSCVVTVGAPPFGDMARVMAASTAFFESDASDERKRLMRENLARVPPGTSPAQAVLAQTPARFFDPRFDHSKVHLHANATPADWRNICPFGRRAANAPVRLLCPGQAVELQRFPQCVHRPKSGT